MVAGFKTRCEWFGFCCLPSTITFRCSQFKLVTGRLNADSFPQQDLDAKGFDRMIDGLRCADLHVHSSFSRNVRPQWFFRGLRVAECYTSPERVYSLARERHMDYVTITDHDTIDGVLEIAHLENVFTGVEISTRFPEEMGVIHVVALGFTEPQYADMRKCQDNIYELVRYLNESSIAHFLAHPFYAGGTRLSAAALQKLFLLFETLEGLSGSRNARQGALLDAVLQRLTPERVNEWANSHDIAPVGPNPHRKSLVGGSDDHAGLAIARAYTTCEAAGSAADFVDAVRCGRMAPCGEVGTSLSLAASVYGMAYRYFEDRTEPETHCNIYKRFFANFVPSFRQGRSTSRLDTALRQRLLKVLARHPELVPTSLLKAGHTDYAYRTCFKGINEVFNQVLGKSCEALAADLSALNLERSFQTIGELASAHFFLSGYYGAFSHQNSDRRYLQDMAREFNVSRAVTGPRKVAVFSDCAFEVNGVALSLRRMMEAAEEAHHYMRLVTSSDRPSGAQSNVVNFQCTASFPMPHYEGMRLYIPPFLELLDWCERNEITTIQVSTPGPVGIAGLLIARLLSLPVVGFYHTNLPDLVSDVTGDAAIGRGAEIYTRWFYRQVEMVFVSSQSSADDLTRMGVDSACVHLAPRGVDSDMFCPSLRDPAIWDRFQVNGDLKLLYVGRMSREKGLDVLAQSFKRLVSSMKGIRLIMVGDGPYKESLERDLAGCDVNFTGTREGDELRRIYASSDLFVFPSPTDTFGNVVLEAQASGLPVLVSDSGGARENIQPGVTGEVVAGGPEAFAHAARKLLNNPERRREMGRAARAYARQRDLRRAFAGLWGMYPGGAES